MLFFDRPIVNALPKIPIDIKIGVPINKVIKITKALLNGISNNIDNNGMKIIIGKHVKIQQAIILKKKTSSTDASDVKYISIIPLLKSSLKKLFEDISVVKIVVIHIIPGIIFSNNFFSGPKTKGNMDIIKKNKTNGRNILFKFLKYKLNSFCIIIFNMF